MTKKSIEDLFKDSFEDFEAEVSPTVWENIKTGLKGAGLGLLGRTIMNKMGTNSVIAIVSSAVTVIATVGVMNWAGNSAKKSETVDKSKQAIVTNNPSELAVKQVSTANRDTKAEEKPTLETSKTNTINLSAASSEKKVTTDVSSEQDMQETKIVVMPFHKDKKKIQTVIKTFSELPVASIFASPIGGTVPLIVNLSNSGNGKTNKWKYSDGKKEDKTANPIHVFETPGIYTITLVSTDDEGKAGIDSIKVEVTGNSSMSKPAADFTPNGDGFNDVFVFQSKNIVKMNAQIFDRKGKLVYEWDGIGGKWDGSTTNGEEAKEGIYFFIVNAEGKDGKKYEQKGAINLTR